MTVTEATQQDWTNFWEESPMATIQIQETKVQEHLTINEARSLRDEIIEQIEIAFAVWGDEDCFEQTALTALVADSFLDKGVL